MDQSQKDLLVACIECVRAADAYLDASQFMLEARVGLKPEAGAFERLGKARSRLEDATDAAIKLLKDR